MPFLERAQQALETRGLTQAASVLHSRLETAVARQSTYLDFLADLLDHGALFKSPDAPGPAAVLQDPGPVRLFLPAFHRRTADPGIGDDGLRSECDQRLPPGSARGLEDPPGRSAGVDAFSTSLDIAAIC